LQLQIIRLQPADGALPATAKSGRKNPAVSEC
jgi:hypothetical protein